MPCSAPPETSIGSRSGDSSSRKRAPISASGAVMRRIGRLRSDASPVSTDANGRDASRPIINREVVPLLPQSSGCDGARHASIPRPRTTISPASSGGAGTSQPSARSTDAVLRQSSPGRRPERRLSPSAAAASISARWVIDLSPGTVTSPEMRRLIRPAFEIVDRVRRRNVSSRERGAT